MKVKKSILLALLTGSLFLGSLPVLAEEAITLPQLSAIPHIEELATQFNNDLNDPDLQAEENGSLLDKYDLRDSGLSTSVKNQSPLNDCYAFSAMAAVESNYLKQTGTTEGTIPKTPDYSVKQLAYFGQHPRPEELTQAGEGRQRNALKGTDLDFAGATMSLGQLSNREGPVNTSDVPHTSNGGLLVADETWTVGEEWRSVCEARLQNADILPSPANWSTTGKYEKDNAAITSVKEALINNGAVGIFIGIFIPTTKEEAQKVKLVWNEEKGCYYFQEGTTANVNHAVTVIGWDDNYDKENFNATTKPKENGAFLIKNSSGDVKQPYNYMNRVPNDEGDYDYGYFWVSYEEPTLVVPISYEVDPGADDYDAMAQYDYLNVKSSVSAESETMFDILKAKKIAYDAEESVANVFTAEGYQSLDAVSAFTPSANNTVKIAVYVDGTEGAPESGTLAVSQTTPVDEGGFHTILLDHSVALREGQTYTVVETIVDNKGQNYLPVEVGYVENGDVVNSYQAVANAGESYLSTSGSWIDLSTLGEVEGENITYTVGNAMIKAYTNTRSAEPEELVMDMIDALGDITSLDQEAQVVAARAAYEALTPEQKTWVTNLSVLEAAEAKIAALKAAAGPTATTAGAQTSTNAHTGITAGTPPVLPIAVAALVFMAISLALVYLKKQKGR